MKTILKAMALSAIMVGCGGKKEATTDDFEYNDERFADLQMLRYKVEGFDSLTLQQKTFIYYLQEAALWGRDILWDQNGRYNLRLRYAFETIYQSDAIDHDTDDFRDFEVYLKRMWFSNGIHHHYASDKFVPEFSQEWLCEAWDKAGIQEECVDKEELCKVIFDPTFQPKRVNLAEGQDLVLTSASNYYEGVTQAEAEEFYENEKKKGDAERPVMHGMNSRLTKDADGKIVEKRWTTNGLYGQALTKIVENLRLARPFAEDDAQREVIDKLIAFYESGDLKDFDEYTIAWVNNTEPIVDFVNGFTESYGDPLGLKASWESIVNFKDLEATKRTETICKNAQWFEDNNPVAPEFKKEKVKGISAKVINAAILAGDLYPSTAIGINLPNSDWVRAEHGSKSVTIGNLTSAYDLAAKGSGMMQEFAYSQEEIDLLDKYSSLTDDLHTDLHECLGHGSGKLLPGVSADSLRAYGSTIEEARADLFALYYLADPKLVELGLLPNMEAYKAAYIREMQNGLITQLVRINLGDNIEEAHMRDRALIARWAFEKGKANNVMEFVDKDGKTFLKINDYEALRSLFAQLLAEIQRIKSTGDFKAAQALVENYGVKIDRDLHKQVLDRYAKLNIAPYKGFINPVYTAVRDAEGNITDVTVSYEESYADQMLRYGRDYKALPLVNE